MKKKTFVFYVEDNNKNFPKHGFTTKVYQIMKDGHPEYVGQKTYNSQSYRNHLNEAFAVIVEQGHLTKKDNKTIGYKPGGFYNGYYIDLKDNKDKYKLYQL